MQVQTEPKESYETFHVRQNALRAFEAPTRYVAPSSQSLLPGTLRQSSSTKPAARSKSPVVDAVQYLVRSMFATMVRPALKARTVDEWTAVVTSKWADFVDAIHSVHVLLAQAPLGDRRDVGDQIEAFAAAAERLAGPTGADEARFCSQTYVRALRIARSLTERPAEDKVAEDRTLVGDFRHAVAMHLFGMMSIADAAQKESEATTCAIDQAFEFLRGGALEAYAAVRSAEQLRAVPENDSDEGPHDLDDEDHLLASIDDHIPG